MITKKLVVRSFRFRKEFGGIQQLVAEYYIGRWRIWSKVLDEEEIPSWAHIQLAALGFTDWQSKFAEHIK